MQTNISETTASISNPSASTQTASSVLSTNSEFQRRHIGPSEFEKAEMLKTLGFSHVDEMMAKVVPKSIMTKEKMAVGDGVSEYEILNQLKAMMSKNKIFQSLIGMG